MGKGGLGSGRFRVGGWVWRGEVQRTRVKLRSTYLVASHRTGEQENCSKDGLAGSSPEQEE